MWQTGGAFVTEKIWRVLIFAVTLQQKPKSKRYEKHVTNNNLQPPVGLPLLGKGKKAGQQTGRCCLLQQGLRPHPQGNGREQFLHSRTPKGDDGENKPPVSGRPKPENQIIPTKTPRTVEIYNTGSYYLLATTRLQLIFSQRKHSACIIHMSFSAMSYDKSQFLRIIIAYIDYFHYICKH